MPALPSVPKVLKIDFIGHGAPDQDVVNRFFMQYTGTAPNDIDLATFAGAVVTQWAAHLASQISGAFGLDEVVVEDLSSPSSAVGSAASTAAGTRSGNALPIAVAAVIKFLIARRYRGGHPRMYLYAGTETDLATGSLNSWTSAFLTSLEAAWQNFIIGLGSSGWTGAGTLGQVNVSYYQGFTNFLEPSGRYRARPNVRAVPVVDAVLDSPVNPKMGTQRRRFLQSK